jgi:hypothetical protein
VICGAVSDSSPRGFFFSTKHLPFTDPLRSSIAPEVEKDFERRTLEGTKLKNMKAHEPGGNRKPKNSVRKVDDIKILSKTTKRSLEKQTNSGRAELKLATPEGSDEEKSTPLIDRRNKAAELTFNNILNPDARAKVKAREFHSSRRWSSVTTQEVLKDERRCREASYEPYRLPRRSREARWRSPWPRWPPANVRA